MYDKCANTACTNPATFNYCMLSPFCSQELFLTTDKGQNNVKTKTCSKRNKKSAPCFCACEAIKCRLIFQKELQMCTKYLYIVTLYIETFLQILEKRKSIANFPTNFGKYEKVQETFLQILEYTKKCRKFFYTL